MITKVSPKLSCPQSYCQSTSIVRWSCKFHGSCMGSHYHLLRRYVLSRVIVVPTLIERTQRLSTYGKELRDGVSDCISFNCIGCSDRTAFSRLPFLRGQIPCFRCAFPDHSSGQPPLRRIGTLFPSASSLIFGPIIAAIGLQA